jgi:hypothetical protein
MTTQHFCQKAPTPLQTIRLTVGQTSAGVGAVAMATKREPPDGLDKPAGKAAKKISPHPWATKTYDQTKTRGST